MRRIKILAIILLVFLLIPVAFSKCVIRPVPYEYFDSLQELKDSIGNVPNIYFPDTERYVFSDEAKFQKVYKGKSNILQGYYFNDELDASESDTSLFYLQCICNILEKQYDERNPAPPLNANTKVLGTDVNEKIREESGDPNMSASDWYPEGSKIVNFSYQFDFKGCRYTVKGNLVIPPEKLNTLDDLQIESTVERGKNEVLDLVKSIIEQGGKVK